MGLNKEEQEWLGFYNVLEDAVNNGTGATFLKDELLTARVYATALGLKFIQFRVFGYLKGVSRRRSERVCCINECCR